MNIFLSVIILNKHFFCILSKINDALEIYYISFKEFSLLLFTIYDESSLMTQN